MGARGCEKNQSDEEFTVSSEKTHKGHIFVMCLFFSSLPRPMSQSLIPFSTLSISKKEMYHYHVVLFIHSLGYIIYYKIIIVIGQV